ncbi:hypothetical protein LSCM1_00673 [Leishmania martiniquensis]|uniref:Uncharacterized protein n=1 Tax=Leishmania martiniquensis TaxID=1580590 RepID=A0A836KGA8_9TRYP|nr:hypothetical protein LSCM1_00673 [Leishmania martiniquensis]
MDITRFNQFVALPDFAREVQRCEFCALDQEMSGVDLPGGSLPLGAPPAVVYHAKRVAVEAYNAFQMGIALFTKTEAGTYEVRPYNFYLLNNSGDLRLSLPAISFLAANHMNFQNWLTAGLPFCNEEEEHAYEQKRQALFTDEDEKHTAATLIEAIDAWLPTASAPLFKELSCSIDFASRLQTYIGRHYDSRITTSYDGKPYLAQKIKFTFTKLSEDDWAGKREKYRLRCEHEKARKLGFRQFWKLLVQSKKPIVGHNFMQDVMFMIHMHETTLPENYIEFKKLLQRKLPAIYDTKTMAAKLTGDIAFQATHLEGLYQECRRRVGLSSEEFTLQYRLPPGFYSYNDYAVMAQNKAHEAAYDAYMTGIVYLLLHKLHPSKFSDLKNVISAFGSSYFFCVDTDDELVNPDTFVLKCAAPCYSEEIEAIFYATEKNATNAADDGRIDMRKLSYKVTILPTGDDMKKHTAFCIQMRQSTGLDELTNRLQSLREKELPSGIHVNLSLLDSINLQKVS